MAVRNVSPAALVFHLGQTRWGWLVLAALANLAMVGARGVRWRWLFHPASPAPGPLVSATAIGYLANNLLPLRMGEVVRGYLAARSGGVSVWTALATLAVERVLDALTILAILAAVVLVVDVPLWLETAALTLLALDLLAMGLLIALARQPGPVGRRLERLPRVGRTLAGGLAVFSTGLASLRAGPHLLPLLGWTVVLWVLNALAVWMALLSASLALPPSAILAVLTFAGIGVALPSAPGYVGTLQFFTVQALAVYAVTGAEALSFSFLYHAASYVPLSLLGWACLVLQGLSFHDARREAARAASR